MYCLDWRLGFISQKSQAQFLAWIARIRELQAVCTGVNCTPEGRLEALSALKATLTAIRDRIIGNNCCKYFFVRNGLLPVLVPLLWLKDESSAEFTRLVVECQRDTLTLFSVLISQSGDLNEEGLGGGEGPQIFSNLAHLLATATLSNTQREGGKFLEILTRAMVCFAHKVQSTRDLCFDGETLPVLLSFLREPAGGSSAIIQNVCSLLAAGCDTRAKQDILMNARVLPMLLTLLNASVCGVSEDGNTVSSSSSSLRIGVIDFKVLDGVIELLATLTRDCPEACEVVALSPFGGSKKMPTLLFGLLNVSLLSTEFRLKVILL